MLNGRTRAATRGSRRTEPYNDFRPGGLGATATVAPDRVDDQLGEDHVAHRRRDVVGHRSGALLPLALLAALLLGGSFFVLAAPAQAVTPVAADPRDRQKVSEAPGAVTLAFSRDVDASVAKLIVVGPDGKNVTSGALIVEGTNVTSYLQDGLPKGTYTVHYRVDGKNGEPEGGAYQFSYGGGSFTDLPDRSWSGEDDEPAVLRGSDPNSSGDPETPSATTQTPGIEVTSQAPSSAPPPPTDPPSTVKAPSGPASDESTDVAGNEPVLTASATPAPDAGSGGTPWIIGGVLLLLAVGGTAFGLWHKNKERAAGHD